MQVNKISNISYVNFRENELSRAMDSQDAILMLRDPNASVRFQQNQEIAEYADAVSSNPLKALGYKLYRTFNMIRDNDSEISNEQKHLNTLA